ncbi:hypothetical protein AJ80_07042 [Polytolypa hystricis UAMH7299]|uniref:3-keto-steroid reductase n=1 Tax=Polytolypa hystricis (strain UAMH7299) TaxID=1447883 RepID=A0A2B7XIW8_POLH7|nr:hypothetical protein AJ80_07042 [Polytolypa hystricis UAMH7299]
MASISELSGAADQEDTYILVTGTNSGLGFSICCRLIDNFLISRPRTHSLTLLFTTRSPRKSNETLTRLQNHLRSVSRGNAATENRVKLQPEHVDLGDLLSVRALARRLLSSTPKLDVLVLNAGIAGFTGLNWFRAAFMIVTNLIHAVTWPAAYCLSKVGVIAKKQTSLPDEPPLGELFCANVFGHYMLSHALMPLLSKSSDPPSRIIWTSSLEATSEVFDVSDIQGLRISRAYESSKYLTDVLALTSNLPSAAPWVNTFMTPDDLSSDPEKPSQQQQPLTKPNIYLSHPGICGTSIMPLMLPLFYAMLGAFWMARLFGSPWHVMSAYKGAAASVWLSLAPQSVLDTAEAAYAHLGGGKVKWGSSCDRLGHEKVVCTEVEGWGFGGLVGGAASEDDKKRMRKTGAKDLTADQRVEFEELGRKCWREMEELRVKWDKLLTEEENKRLN